MTEWLIKIAITLLVLIAILQKHYNLFGYDFQVWLCEPDY